MHLNYTNYANYDFIHKTYRITFNLIKLLVKNKQTKKYTGTDLYVRKCLFTNNKRERTQNVYFPLSLSEIHKELDNEEINVELIDRIVCVMYGRKSERESKKSKLYEYLMSYALC